jgi:hypothetical protein
VAALRLPAIPRSVALSTIAYKTDSLRSEWANSLLPVSRHRTNLLGDIQLGYGLWACLLFSVWGAAATRPGRSLMACFGIILLFAWPLPVVTRLAWRTLPTEMLVITNQWPIERFYMLLTPLAAFVAAPVLSRYSSRGSQQRFATATLLLCACLWSAAEALRFVLRVSEASHSETASLRMHLPENITLSRILSYEYLGLPEYFSNGHMDPLLETRLLDNGTLDAFADGATYRPGFAGAGPGTRSFSLSVGKDGVCLEKAHIGPTSAVVMRFDFLGQELRGELQIVGGSIYDLYTLPQSGALKSFGSGPASSHTLILRNSTQEADDISFRFVRQGGQGGGGGILAQVSVEPMSEEKRVIRIDSLAPFHLFVTAGRDCLLETPRLFIPGYRTLVDGVMSSPIKSPQGLVAIPLKEGEHEVTLAYDGGPFLRASYAVSCGAWVVLLCLVVACSAGREPFAKWIAAVERLAVAYPSRLVRRPALVWSIMAAAALAFGTLLCLRAGLLRRPRFGAVQMVIRLPGPLKGQSEPLLTTGHPGAGDFIYVTYVDGGHVKVGHDKWSVGGKQSGPITVDYREPQTVEISLDSLFPDGGSREEEKPGEKGTVRPRHGIFVKWNGVLVLSEDAVAYPSKPSEITVGENAIGGSSTLRSFSGQIVHVAREGEVGSN